MARNTTIVSLTLNKDVLQDLDDYVETTPFSRSKLVNKYIQEGLERDEKYNIKKVIKRATRKKD